MGESDARVGKARAGRLNRLPRRSDFLRLTASRTRIATPGFLLQAAPAPADQASQPLRVGFTASRKIGNAVARNRARRRLRALAASVMPDRARPDWDYVLVARQAVLQRDFATLSDDLGNALLRLRAGRGSQP
jgi:ribonuclease P protein component